MALPVSVKTQVEALFDPYCLSKSPAHLRDKIFVSYEFYGSRVTIVENRPSVANPGRWTKSVVARFRYNSKLEHWTLYWANRNSKWFPYTLERPNKSLKRLLEVVERNETGIFWG